MDPPGPLPEKSLKKVLEKLLTNARRFSNIQRSQNERHTNGVLAQLGEHLPYKQRVTGSSPVGPTSSVWTACIRGLGRTYGEIAQLARARGSYPRCREFKSPSRYQTGTMRKHGAFLFCSNIYDTGPGIYKYVIVQVGFWAQTAMFLSNMCSIMK